MNCLMIFFFITETWLLVDNSVTVANLTRLEVICLHEITPFGNVIIFMSGRSSAALSWPYQLGCKQERAASTQRSFKTETEDSLEGKRLVQGRAKKNSPNRSDVGPRLGHVYCTPADTICWDDNARGLSKISRTFSENGISVANRTIDQSNVALLSLLTIIIIKI